MKSKNMQWQSVKNKNISSAPVVKVFFTSLFLLIVLLLLVPLEANGATACGNSCQLVGDCPLYYLTPTGVCCSGLDWCGLTLMCMYHQTDLKTPCNDYCSGNIWKYNATISCTSGGWACNYETESCLSCGCCNAACSAAIGGCSLIPNHANCPIDKWVNSGSSYSCCSADNSQVCTCQDQQYLDYYCDGSDQGYCACKYNPTDTRTIKSSCVPDTCGNFSSPCDTSGTYITCGGACTRNTDGTACSTTNTCNGSCAWYDGQECLGGICSAYYGGGSCATGQKCVEGSCVADTCGNFSSTCDTSGTYITCGGACTRNTDGNSCGSSSCPSDICTGTCPGCLWRDYPSSCTRYCYYGSCQTCSCSSTDRDPDAALSYCTGCGKTWDSTASKCCGDDGGATDTWCNTGGGACVSGAWHLNHCSDGIQDCDETGVDIGGACGCNLNRTGDTTINFPCVLEGEYHLVGGNLTITTGGSLQMNANSKLIFDLGHEIKIEGTGSILKSASNTIIQQQ